MISVKNKFPFRIGTSSYIIPDEIMPNIKYLSQKVDDIEILLFESDEISNLPSNNTLNEMKKIASENNLTYNIHLPIDIALGALDESTRSNSVQKCLRVIKLMDAVKPLAYILHLTGNTNIMGEGSTETIEDWLPSIRKSLSELIENGVDPTLLCIETLSYPFYFLDNLIKEFNLSVCLDIGHLLIYNFSLEEHLNKYLSRTKVIHLHGIKNGKDHNSIRYLTKATLELVVNAISQRKENYRILTLEIFNEEDFLSSIEIISGYV